MLHYNMPHKPNPIPKAMTIPEAKAALDKERGTLQKLLAWDESKEKSNAEVIRRASFEGEKVHFATLVVSSQDCHPKISGVENEFRKVQRKSDSGNCAVFTEQIPSASQLAAANVLDAISRLPGCSGQASDAVSASTQLENERRTRTSSSFGRRLSKDLDQIAKSKKTIQNWDHPVVPPERSLYGHPSAGLLWKEHMRKFSLKPDGKKSPNGNVHPFIA